MFLQAKAIATFNRVMYHFGTLMCIELEGFPFQVILAYSQ